MLLDVRKIFSTYQNPICQTIDFDLSQMDFPGYEIKEPVQVKYCISLQGALLHLNLEMSANAVFGCARCLEEAQQNFCIETSYDIRESDCEQSLEAELPFDEHGRLDLQELCYEDLVAGIPSVLLCSSECAGLCPVCGRRNPCACTQETNGDVVDERLAILKTLL